MPCGVLRLGNKDSDDPGHGTIVEDNILGEISTEGATTVGERSNNLLADDSPSGPGEIRGKPTYVGGATPTSYADYRLNSGSLGKGKASDGLDIGARIEIQPSPPGSGPGDAAGNDSCDQAKHKVKKAKTKLHRAKRRVHRADGHKQTAKAKKKLHKAKKKLHRAKKAKHRAC